MLLVAQRNAEIVQGKSKVISLSVMMDPTSKGLLAVPAEFHAAFKEHLVIEAEAVQAELRAAHDKYEYSILLCILSELCTCSCT